MCTLVRFDLANRGVRQPVQSHAFYARLLVFGDTLAQPHFDVVNCSEAVMSVFYFPVLIRSLMFFAVMNCFVVALSYFPPLFKLGALKVYIQCNATLNKGSACRRICLLCQQTSPKRWIGNMNMTSNCDVTKSAHQVQMTNICHWMNPHETFLRNPLNITQYRHDKEALRTTCIKNVKFNNGRLLVGSLLYSET